MMQSLFRAILRRPFFRGQDRIFSYLFSHNKLGKNTVIVKPLQGDFNIKCDPSTWIGAKIIYTGDYEPALSDEVVGNDKVDFIKIDVEGYESFVIDGLIETIKKNRPKIVFEYYKYYHQKTGCSEDYIFSLLQTLGYHFQHIYNEGPQVVDNFHNLVSGNILALPHE